MSRVSSGKQESWSLGALELGARNKLICGRFASYLDLLLRRPFLESFAEVARRRRITSAAAAFDMAEVVWMK